MKKYRKLSICISVLNAIVIVCLFYCAALYLSHDTYVVNPDAMLPMMNWERGGMMLTMGVMPMLIANTLVFLFVFKKGTSIIKRLLFSIPSILEVILVLHYWIASLLEFQYVEQSRTEVLLFLFTRKVRTKIERSVC